MREDKRGSNSSGSLSGFNATGWKRFLYNYFQDMKMLDLVTVDGKARGIIVRNLDTGDIERHAAHAVILATGGYGKILLSVNPCHGCNGSAIWRAHKKEL